MHEKQALEPQNGPSDEAPSLPDPGAYDIAFIRDDFPEYDTVPKHIARANGYLFYSLMAVILMISGVLVFAVQAASVGVTLIIACSVVLLVAALVTLITWDVRSTFERGGAIRPKIPFESLKSSKRIHICVLPRLAIRMIRSLPQADHGFEPEVARVPLALGFDAHTRRLAVLGGILGLAGAVIGLTVFGWDRVHIAVIFWFVMGMCMLGSVVIPEFFFATYVRVIPGRLDVIRAPLIGSSMHTLASFDLRGRPLVINEVALYVEPPREPGTPRPAKIWSKRWSQGMIHPPECNPEAVSLIMSPARRQLLLAIVQAAVTHAPTPEIPPDKLVG